MRYLDDELNKPGKLEMYLIQIAAEIRSVLNSFWWVKSKRKISVQDFTIQYSRGEADLPEQELTEEQEEELAQEQMEHSKAAWGVARAVLLRNRAVLERNEKATR